MNNLEEMIRSYTKSGNIVYPQNGGEIKTIKRLLQDGGLNGGSKWGDAVKFESDAQAKAGFDKLKNS